VRLFRGTLPCFFLNRVQPSLTFPLGGRQIWCPLRGVGLGCFHACPLPTTPNVPPSLISTVVLEDSTGNPYPTGDGLSLPKAFFRWPFPTAVSVRYLRIFHTRVGGSRSGAVFFRQPPRFPGEFFFVDKRTLPFLSKENYYFRFLHSKQCRAYPFLTSNRGHFRPSVTPFLAVPPVFLSFPSPLSPRKPF